MQLQKLDTQVVVESAGAQSGGSDPDLIVLSDGRLLMVWAETLVSPTDAFEDTDGAVFGQILSADGQPEGDVFQINEFETFDQGRPQAIAMSNGGFAVGWTSTAVYGDTPIDADSFVQYFDSNGQRRTTAEIDLGVDSPGDNEDQILREMVSLGGDRFVAILEDANPEGYDAQVFVASTLRETAFSNADDLVVLENGNILRAEVGDDQIDLILSGASFGAPAGIQGVYQPLKFSLLGTEDLAEDHAIGDLELAALTGGGFAVAYVEEVGESESALRLEILTDVALKEFEAEPVSISFAFDDARGDFDMIGLSNGNLALAMTTLDANGTSTGVDILLFNADGSLDTRLQASQSDDGNQGSPSLVELPDGRLALAYVDDSASIVPEVTETLRISYFEVTGDAGRFVGTSGDDFLGGVSGNDVIYGDDGNDDIRGRNGDDRLRGGDGEDTIFGGNGADALRGGEGDDHMFGGKGNDGVRGGLGDDSMNGGEGRDELGGGAGNDTLNGGNNNDILRGGAGNDELQGQAGRDVLRGGEGDDVMLGGSGQDSFVFVETQTGSDTISDFNVDEDRILIDLRGGAEDDLAVSNSAGNTLITLNNIDVTLEGVTLQEGDITFLFF